MSKTLRSINLRIVYWVHNPHLKENVLLLLLFCLSLYFFTTCHFYCPLLFVFVSRIVSVTEILAVDPARQ